MDLTELFSQYPYLREGITAITVIFVNICALVILIAAQRERHHDDKSWANESRSLMLRGDGGIYPLGAAELLIGRHPSADIPFPDGEISRFHALITLSNGCWQIEDLGAANGVSVNGRRISQPCVLHQDDVISVGNRLLTVVRGRQGRGGA